MFALLYRTARHLMFEWLSLCLCVCVCLCVSHRCHERWQRGVLKGTSVLYYGCPPDFSEQSTLGNEFGRTTVFSRSSLEYVGVIKISFYSHYEVHAMVIELKWENVEQNTTIVSGNVSYITIQHHQFTLNLISRYITSNQLK